jgi:hypothetical protein
VRDDNPPRTYQTARAHGMRSRSPGFQRGSCEMTTM